jgi:hypothetical protein
MNINQDNYEQYFLDHAEGNLSAQMERELADFLEANPDLKPVLNDFDPSPLPIEQINNDSLKKRLKKNILATTHIDQDNVDEWMIRDVEGQLDESEEIELKEFLSLNPAYNFDYKIFSMTRLVPDPAISFPRKDELKKKVVLLPASRLAWLLPAAAAVILIFFGIRYLNKPEVNSLLPLDTPGIQAVVEIPEWHPLDVGTPSHETPSHETPSHELANSFRIKPFAVSSIVSLNPSESSQIKMVACNISSIRTAEKKNKSLISKVFGNMVAQARDGLRKSANLKKIEKTDLNIWSIAKAGINGYNSISDRDLELYVRRDAEGKIKSYALLEEDHLILSKDLKKN